MSQNEANAIESKLTILRVSTGRDFPILWSPDLTPEKLNEQGVLTLIKVEDGPVNLLREKALKEVQTPWVWMIDSDVILSKEALDKVKALIQSKELSSFGLVGGTYQSSQNMSLIERSYNRLCNLWSKSHDIPLAGNLLLSKELLSADFSLKEVPFGKEEHYFYELCKRRGLGVGIFDFPLIHFNKKTLQKMFERCLSQANDFRERPKLPLKAYFKNLIHSLIEAPLETLVALSYLIMNFSASARSQALKSLKEAPHKKSPQTKH